ncbi:MAG: hypothetical protein JWO14_3915 [Solirubrobacterales bacterium]|nr:hypothetical protein [Solirubrobacterales bacterium]
MLLSRNRSTKHRLAILLALLASTTVFAALAAASASAHTWKIDGSNLSGSANVALELPAGTVATLTATLLGQEVIIDMSHLTSEEGKITQNGTVAEDSGKLIFSGVTVRKPSNCDVTSPIKTKALKTELVAHNGSTHFFDKFVPASGEVFSTIEVTGCSLEGLYNLKGSFYGEGETWGNELVNEPLAFSPAINTTLGGSLTWGSNPGTLTMHVLEHLSVAHVGSVFGAVE